MTLITRRIAGLGWRPDTPDNRDFIFKPKKKITRVPAKVDLRDSGFMPPVYDQGNLGSCTANGIGAAYEYEQKRQGLLDYTPSRLAIYYGERVIEGTVNSDAGAEIRDGMKVIAKEGCPDEKLWPYNTLRFRDTPSQEAYLDGQKHKALTYASVAVKALAVQQALASGTPVIIGFSVYDWFESPLQGGVIKPVAGAGLLGGHCTLLVGYERLKGHSSTVYAIMRNSWGTSWADSGYCYFPLHWLTTNWNADDFWAIQSVEA